MSVDVAVEFLCSWAPDGPWLLGEIDPELEARRVPAHLFTDQVKLQTYLADRINRVNLYFCPNIVDPTKNITTTPTKDQIYQLTSLYIDLDLPKTGPYTEPTEENFARLLSRLKALEPPPSVTIFSGGGYQAYWIFPPPYLQAKEYIEQVEAASKTISRTLKSDAVQNINRWLRLPGTMNLPNEAKRSRGRVPKEARVIEAYWDRRWSIHDDPIPHFPDDVRAYVDLDPDANPTADQDSTTDPTKTLADLPVKWQRLAVSGDAKDYGGDRSRLVFAFCAFTVRRGWSDTDITQVLTNPSLGIASHILAQSNPPSYAARQARQARTKIAEDWDYTGQGRLDATSPRNVRRALQELGIKLSHNTFSDRSYVNGVGPFRQLDDPAEAEMRIMTYDRFRFLPPKDVLRDVTATVARANSFHPVTDYLNTLVWDQTPRIDNWLTLAAQASDTPLIRAFSRLILIAAVRRIRYPGCKFDQMLVLISPEQGTGKSSAVAALCADPSWFSDSVPLKLTDQKAIEQLAGHWIIECGELQGMHQNDIETMKGFLSRTEDRARLAYGHHPVNYARRCVFFGTTNAETFLRDTQNRRFWPVVVQKIDVQWIIDNRDQLWAEAAHHEASGESIVLAEELWNAAGVAQEEARYGDPWVDELYAWFAPIENGRIASNDVWKLLGKPAHQRSPLDNGHLTEAMRELGWNRAFKRLGNTPMRCFTKGNTDDRQEWFVLIDPVDKTISLQASPSPRSAAGHLHGTTPEDLPF